MWGVILWGDSFRGVSVRENITFLQLRLRAVIIYKCIFLFTNDVKIGVDMEKNSTITQHGNTSNCRRYENILLFNMI